MLRRMFLQREEVTEEWRKEYHEVLHIWNIHQVCWGTRLQAGRSRVRFPMVSLEFFIDIILSAANLWCVCVCVYGPAKHRPSTRQNICESPRVISFKHSSVLPDDGSHKIRNMSEWFLIFCLLNFYTTYILTSKFCIMECISRTIKVIERQMFAIVEEHYKGVTRKNNTH